MNPYARDLLGWGSETGDSGTVHPSEVLGTISVLNTACLVETLLYGVHVVLFCVSTFVILKHNPSKQKVFLVSIVLMFGLSTADMAFTFRVMLKDFRLLFDGRSDILVSRVYPKSPIFVSNNCIADFLLLYRCFMIWGRQPYIAAGSSILLIADTVWGWIGAGSPIFSLSAKFAPVFYWTVFGTNIIMTAATAGRIYWLSHISRPVLGDENVRKYHTATAIIVESGAVYSFCLLGLLLTFGNPNLRVLFAGITIRVVAIMPNLMIVQVKLGRSIPLVDDVYLQTASRRTLTIAPVVLDTIVVTASHRRNSTAPSAKLGSIIPNGRENDKDTLSADLSVTPVKPEGLQ